LQEETMRHTTTLTFAARTAEAMQRMMSPGNPATSR